MEERFVDMLGVLGGVLKDLSMPGAIVLLVALVLPSRIRRRFAAFVRTASYFNVTTKRKPGSWRVAVKGNGSDRWMRLHISWGRRNAQDRP